MAASISLATHSIFHRDTVDWNSYSRSIHLTPVRILPRRFISRIRLATGSKGGRGSKNTNSFPNPADIEPPEVSDDDDEAGLNRFQRVEMQAARARKAEQEKYQKNKHVFLNAIGLGEEEEEEQGTQVDNDDPEIVRSRDAGYDGDFFAEVDEAVAMKRKELIKEGVLKPQGAPKKHEQIDDLEPEEALDIEEIAELQGMSGEIELEGDDVDGLYNEGRGGGGLSSPRNRYSDLEFVDFEAPEAPEILDPEFCMALGELLDEAKVIPLSVDGDLEVEIRGIQHDSREVNMGDLFVCCAGSSTNGHIYLTEAVKRGAVAVIVSKDIPAEKAAAAKAMVVVEDTNSILPALAASFYRNPSEKLTVIGITGTNGKSTTSYLIKSMYETMGLRTGLLGTIAYYIHSNHKLELEAPLTTPDAVDMQKLMAKMLHNGSEACVMEASSHGLAQGRCDKVDFDIAVFTNLTRDHMDYHKTQQDYREAKGKLFAKMTDPERHRKVVNIDDPTATYFVAQGNPDVPVITFSRGNKNADVYALDLKLSLFETQVLTRTPDGNLEISSGLLGRHNVYNILAAVAVGIAVGAPLEDIVKGIEEVDAVPGRMELIDEEQAFAVIVDYAHTPDALASLLDTVRECGAKRIITVFGCGGDRDRGKRPLMTKIATDKSDVCILTSDDSRTEDPLDIIDDMLAGVGLTMQEYLRWGEDGYYPPLPNRHRLFVYDIRGIAVRAGIAMGEEGDAVVIAGKGHETYQIIGDKKEYYDDRDVCREALQCVDDLHAAGIDTSEFPWRFPDSH